jgi:3-hydroxyisobutyrate dehydrogenase
MAARLLSAGFPLSVYNRSVARTKPFVDAGATLASSPRQAAAESEIVISMVSDDVASRATWLGGNGALAGAPANSILVESSTLTVAWVKELAEAAARKNCELLDAPVTGSKAQAASGDLVFLVGGSEVALANVKPVLSVLGREVIHFGASGNGASMKLINNFMCGVQAACLAEAAAFIEATGIDLSQALSILAHGAPGSPLVKTLTARAMARDLNPNFALRLMAKDLGYALEEANRRGIRLETASAALAVFTQRVANGDGDKDLSAVIEYSHH